MAGKVKSHQLTEAERKKIFNDFYNAIASLNDSKEAEIFLNDLLSPSELIMISRRIQIARLLLAGETQAAVRDKLKVGFNTINQVERWLNNGFNGYKTVLKKKKGRNYREKPSLKDDPPYSLSRLRKRYPAHFLLLNLLTKK